jgi:hypothetical protein
MTQPDQFYTVTQAKQKLAELNISVSTGSLRAWCKQFGIGRRLTPRGPWFIPETSLFNFINTSSVTGESKPAA